MSKKPTYEELEQRTKKLEQEAVMGKRAEEALQQKTHDYDELVKELNCLYSIYAFVEKPGISLDEILKGIIDLIPSPGYYPESICYRILLNGKDYQTANFKETNRKQASSIFAHGKIIGSIEACYLEEKPEIDQGLFLKEERGLIDVIAGRLGHIIERMRVEEDKKKLEAQLQQAQKLESVGILAGGIAHDFNNLLSVIMGNISMIKNDVKPEYGVTDFLNEAEKASLLARDLTKQLITFSKGGAPVKKISYISNLIEKATDFALSGSNIGCEINTPDDLWPVEIDQGQIRHVINNVVINAVQAMPKGGTIEVCAENFISGSDKDYEELSLQDGKYVKLSIRDQGTGISDKDLPLIFDPYYSSKERGTQKGMGLGLATAYSIIKQHHGEITAESKVGVGTTINIYLPASEIEVPVQKKLEEKAISGKGRILVMDDEEMVRNMIGQMLNCLGYKVEFSKDGDEAIESYREAMKSDKPFDTVILDLTVRGGMGGKEAIQKLIEIDPDVKGIVSSGHSEDPVMNNFGGYGFCNAIAKPSSMPELSVILDKVITGADVL